MRPSRIAVLSAAMLLVTVTPVAAAPAGTSTALDPGVGVVPQGVQSDAGYAGSIQAHQVSNVDATGAAVSCYRPEVGYFTSDGPDGGYSGMSPCPGATTGEDTGAGGPYSTQVGSNSGYPAAGPMLVKDHSESDVRVDPTNPAHL